MTTITFYSYKGGTGRALALANGARDLARLGLKVVAIDFDLEAPGLHYKFSADPEGRPLTVNAGVVDYIHSFYVEGLAPQSIKDYVVDVPVPGVGTPLLSLIPAGKVPSMEYWSKLSAINWHEMFFSNDPKGIQMFLDLKNRILEELNPDFLLIDSRTGITEMGGVATTLLAERVVCFVLPALENLDGARAVLRSIRKFRREARLGELELTVVLSRLPAQKNDLAESQQRDRILRVLNEEAEELADTLSFQEVFVLDLDVPMFLSKGLRARIEISPDESVLSCSYLELFGIPVKQ